MNATWFMLFLPSGIPFKKFVQILYFCSDDKFYISKYLNVLDYLINGRYVHMNK